jgi:nucleotide-binding universal stress UspA family protein
MTGTGDAPRQAETEASVFNRVIVGVDGTAPGFEACRQAARLADPAAPIEAVAVVHLTDATLAAFEAPRFVEQLEQEAQAALAEAARILGERAHTHFVNGYIAPSLLREIERKAATVIVVGSHGHSRASEILIGGVAGDLVHRAPCSVLIARPAGDATAFPGEIVVGMDGSEIADAAFAAATQLATRFNCPLRVVTALRGKNVDLEHVRLRAPAVEEVDEHPVAALVSASKAGGLVVVGSRGLHGVRSLGSVSERVAHQAACSVLVVRPGRVM